MRIFLFVIGFLLLLSTEILRVYFIMPFPGSQQADTIDIAYFIQSNLGLLRLMGLLVVAWPLYQIMRGRSRVAKFAAGALLLFYAGVFYLFNFKFLADKMFLQPRTKTLSGVTDNKISGRNLVVGVSLNGEAKAYPIEIIGYHHQVRDTIGGEPVMVTYCTVCRTGRVYSPKVDGVLDNFRLVGMDHFNAMFEDGRTHSWWRQVNGESIAGDLKGKSLPVVFSEQMRLESWLKKYPNTKILQPDSTFKKKYEGMADYDEGKEKSDLTGTDSVSWGRKSWVVGISISKEAKAYDWIELSRRHVVNDIVGGVPLVVNMEQDTASFHVWNRIVNKDTLSFIYSDSLETLVDTKSKSIWDVTGTCVDGPLKGSSLQPLQSYQEYWHSWSTFHPQTQQYLVKD